MHNNQITDVNTFIRAICYCLENVSDVHALLQIDIAKCVANTVVLFVSHCETKVCMSEWVRMYVRVCVFVYVCVCIVCCLSDNKREGHEDMFVRKRDEYVSICVACMRKMLSIRIHECIKLCACIYVHICIQYHAPIRWITPHLRYHLPAR